jgi:hypothetical protein
LQQARGRDCQPVRTADQGVLDTALAGFHFELVPQLLPWLGHLNFKTHSALVKFWGFVDNARQTPPPQNASTVWASVNARGSR